MSCSSFLGLITTGDCGATTESITRQISETVNRVMNDVLVKQMSNDKLSTQQIQSIKAQTKIGNIDIKNIDFDQRATIELKSFQANQSESDVKNMMSNIAEQLMSETAKTLTEAGASASTTSSITNITNIMKNELQNNITSEQVKNCIASVYQKQELIAKSEVGDVSIGGINMKQYANAIADCVGQNVTQVLLDSTQLQEAFQAVEKELTTTSKGPFSWLTDIFGNFTTMAIAGGVILVVLMILGVVGFLIFTSMGGIEKVGALSGQSGMSGLSTPGYIPPSTGYVPPSTGYGYGYGYTPQYSYAPGQVGYGLGKLEPSIWAKLTQSTYPVLSRFFDILK